MSSDQIGNRNRQGSDWSSGLGESLRSSWKKTKSVLHRKDEPGLSTSPEMSEGGGEVILKSSYLWRRGSNKQWKRRWFELTETKLRWRDEARDDLSKLRPEIMENAIPLYGIAKVTDVSEGQARSLIGADDSFRFLFLLENVKPDAPAFLLAGQSDIERSEWILALRRQLARLPSKKQGVSFARLRQRFTNSEGREDPSPSGIHDHLTLGAAEDSSPSPSKHHSTSSPEQQGRGYTENESEERNEDSTDSDSTEPDQSEEVTSGSSAKQPKSKDSPTAAAVVVPVVVTAETKSRMRDSNTLQKLLKSSRTTAQKPKKKKRLSSRNLNDGEPKNLAVSPSSVRRSFLHLLPSSSSSGLPTPSLTNPLPPLSASVPLNSQDLSISPRPRPLSGDAPASGVGVTPDHASSSTSPGRTDAITASSSFGSRPHAALPGFTFTFPTAESLKQQIVAPPELLPPERSFLLLSSPRLAGMAISAVVFLSFLIGYLQLHVLWTGLLSLALAWLYLNQLGCLHRSLRAHYHHQAWSQVVRHQAHHAESPSWLNALLRSHWPSLLAPLLNSHLAQLLRIAPHHEHAFTSAAVGAAVPHVAAISNVDGTTTNLLLHYSGPDSLTLGIDVSSPLLRKQVAVVLSNFSVDALVQVQTEFQLSPPGLSYCSITLLQPPRLYFSLSTNNGIELTTCPWLPDYVLSHLLSAIEGAMLFPAKLEFGAPSLSLHPHSKSLEITADPFSHPSTSPLQHFEEIISALQRNITTVIESAALATMPDDPQSQVSHPKKRDRMFKMLKGH